MKIRKVRDDASRCPRWEVAITDDVARVIADAAGEDHPCVTAGESVCANTCDVCWALESGYPLAAAWLLAGATETPAIGAAVGALRFNGTQVPAFVVEFDQWCASSGSESVQCPDCDARVYTNHERGCGSCGADLRIDIDAMTEAYIDTALWSCLDAGGEPLEGLYSRDDIDPATLQEMRDDCAGFAESNIPDLAGMCPTLAGEDFWLTRNHHGAGFWDRGLGDKGERLTAAAHPWGSVDLHLGDDGVIYT